MRDAYTSVGPNGYLIVIEGEAGIGKTRLAEELLRHAQASGARAIATRCYAGEANITYGPFLDGLRVALRMPGRDTGSAQYRRAGCVRSRACCPSWKTCVQTWSLCRRSNSGAQSRLFESSHRLCWQRAAALSPGLLLLDDLHWADAASLDLLAYLVRRLRDYRYLSAGHLARRRACRRASARGCLWPRRSALV